MKRMADVVFGGDCHRKRHVLSVSGCGYVAVLRQMDAEVQGYFPKENRAFTTGQEG